MNQKTYIAFDQYQRYQTIANVIEFYRQENPQKLFKVLEIGSNEHKDLRLFLPNDKIVFTDMTLTETMKQDPDFQQADGINLQFEDKSFDFVVAADVLEHISQENRLRFCNELKRVANIATIICFPYMTQENIDAEERLNVYYKGLYGSDFIWLKEHNTCGLPKIEDIDFIYQTLDSHYFKFYHGNLRTWEKLWYCHFNTCGADVTEEYRHTIDHYYNTAIYRKDIIKPCYRVFYISTNQDCKALEEWINAQWQKEDEENDDVLDILLNHHQYMAQKCENNQKTSLEQLSISTIYWGENGQPYQEENTYRCEYLLSEHDIRIQCSLSQSVDSLRFDPMETPCVVEDLHIYSNAGSLQVIAKNGIEYQGKYVFLEHDPRFNIIIDGKQITSLDIRAHVTPLEFPEHEELLTQLFEDKKQMVQQIEDEKAAHEAAMAKQEEEYKKGVKSNLDKIRILEKNEEELLSKQKELQTSLEHYMMHYNAAIGQREQLKQQLAQAQNAYNVISNAFFWKITKPARMLVDFIKKPFRKSHSAMLIWKGMKCLKQNGFKYTYNKVRDKLKHRQDYTSLAKKPLFTKEELEAQRNFQFSKKIKFSIVVPLYNTPPKFLHEMIQSVIDQTYVDWELCMADGSDKAHSDVGQICRSYSKKYSRIKYRKLDKNLGISGNTNACLDMATGDYIGLFDHDDLLHPAALYEVMRTICETGADFVYTDELTFSEKVSNVITAHFKPDFAPDNLRANNYICHFSVFSKEVLEKAGNFSKEYDGSQDHDFILRATEKAEKIVHIPELLYFWRSHPNSVAEDINSKTYAIDAGKLAVKDHIARLGMSAEVESSVAFPTIYRIKYELKEKPLVSILIPNKNHYEDISRCVQSILSETTYTNYEIVIIDNGSVDEDVLKYYKKLENLHTNIIIKEWNYPFNYALINNYGVQFTSGDQIILLNSDTKIITPNWIEEMLMYAQRDDVGAVGAKLYYSDDTIQHAGVVLGLGAHRTAGHVFYKTQKENVGYMGRLYYAQNYSAVTAACMMIPRCVWDEVGGLDESFAVAFNDVDLCMRIRKAGYLIVWTPYAELYHYESKSRGLEDTPEKCKRFDGEVKRFQERWKKELKAGDPYYNPNLTLDREDFSLK